MDIISNDSRPPGRLSVRSSFDPRSAARIENTWFDLMLTWLDRRRQRRHLDSLDDRMLGDIGLSRGDVMRECAKPFWQE